MSELSRELLDTEAKIADLKKLPSGALVEHLIEVFNDALRRTAVNLIAPGTASVHGGC